MKDSIRYVARFLVSLMRQDEGRQPRRSMRPLLLGILAVTMVTWGYTPVPAAAPASSSSDKLVAELASRAQRLNEALVTVEGVYDKDVAPIERVLTKYRNDDPRLVRRVAVSIVRESRRTRIEPRLLVGVLLVENPMLDPRAQSFMGAQGLMQVMPLHQGRWKPCGASLIDVESNICTGSRIFADYLKSERGNLHQALLRYNGCVRGTNTPDCQAYPKHVLARARVR